ncbi:glycosyl hydrolase [Paenibacillus crassostreae]|uniref:Beta-mannosidase n=1 Tax=Paenibacillus crassostreae TaxID=1763538 RepID=A0A167B9M1_9BACL|nr:glycosyl hydrolase [Paenibacillus crassostreae]AOZ93051.1 beta-mannosidase [Paenibacillus crassostreae]OAB71861.1 beta-mannosidase [Paenibacillus crassostreae]
MDIVKNSTPCNPNASEEVKAVMKYLSSISGKGIITGQHTQTTVQKELRYIEEVTGKLPALCGFELLAYSPNINYEDANEACLLEVEENKNTLANAWDWVLNKKGLLTLTWHWFSPLYGKDKSFYAEHTTFDATQAVIEGTDEYKALIADMDVMAGILQEFSDKNIPILWRPFHESEGTWFWWGAKGPEAAKQLYRIMYDRYTNVHKLNNLIWVWNSPLVEGYVGDDVTDVISRDLYPEKHNHTDLKKEFDELVQITPTNKIVALGEIGVIPSVSQLAETRIPWTWYMTWSNEFGSSEEWNSKEELHKAYHHDYAITLDKLPKLF